MTRSPYPPANIFTLAWLNLPDKNAPSVRIQERDIPQRFIANFLLRGGEGIMQVTLEIFLDPDGSPRAREVRIHSTDFVTVKSPFIQRWQIEQVENEFHRLLTMAVMEVVRAISPGKEGGKSVWVFGKHKPVTRVFEKEVERLTHRRPNDPEHFKRVARIYNEELKRATDFGKRPRMIKEIMDQMNTSRGTAESWVRIAKAIPGLIKPAPPKKDSSPSKARKAVPSKTKSTTTPTKKGRK